LACLFTGVCTRSPAGNWNGETSYGEWIRDSAKIPLDEYSKFKEQFNPQHFDADAIVLAAKNAGMKYIVITTKHHDGFALFDSKLTDWDVMSTPFKRDIMKELADACQRHGIKMCWYHSIMDWHHPDYTPRRPWERADRPDNGNMDRYVDFMKGQLHELLTNYGPIGLLWFDGQWEGSWNDTRGRDLEHFVRSLQPGIIINSRVGRGGGTFGLDGEGGMLGDYATPEQTIPESAIRDIPWETCMTMNGHWGFNAADKNFKSSTDLIQKLADIASKGGNFLLNVGPDADGRIPPESVQRLAEIGAWMDVHGESIYDTVAGPYDKPLPWGCITQKATGSQSTRLYLHVFKWPASGELVLPGMLNTSGRASLMLPDGQQPTELAVHSSGEDLIVRLPAEPTNPHDTVIVLDLAEPADVSTPPTITADADIFVEALTVNASTSRPEIIVRYTTDGSEPNLQSPAIGTQGIRISETTTVHARSFRGERAVSPRRSANLHQGCRRVPCSRRPRVRPEIRLLRSGAQDGGCHERPHTRSHGHVPRLPAPRPCR
jgi:alpha-L-fucosidase